MEVKLSSDVESLGACGYHHHNHGFGKLSMGNEMGNNNTTSGLNEENDARETEKRTNFHEEVIAESMEEGKQKISAAEGNDDDTKTDGLASNDKSEPGNATLRGDTLGDGVKGENQTIPTSEARYAKEESVMASDDATIEPGKDTLEEDSHADDVKEPKQTIAMAEAENIGEKARGLTTVESVSMLVNDSSKSDTHGDVVIVKNQMPPRVEAEDVQNNATSRASNETPNALGNGSWEGDAYEDYVNGDLQRHMSLEAEIVPGKASRIDTDDRASELHQAKTQKETHDNEEQGEIEMDPISEDLDVLVKATSFSSNNQSNVKDQFSDAGYEGDAYEDDVNEDHPKHLSAEGAIVKGKASWIDIDDRTRELHEDKTQKEINDNEEQGENATDPISEDMGVLGKATSLSTDDQSNVKDFFSDAEQTIMEIIEVEKSPNAGLANIEGENCKILSNFSLEGTEECDKQKDLCMKMNHLVINDHHLDNESSIKQEENTTILTTNEPELQELSRILSYQNEFVEVLKEPSLQGSESMQRSDLLETDPLCSLDDDISADKEKETQEKMSCGVNIDDGDEDEFGSSVRYASEIADTSSSISEKSNGNLLAEVNHIADHSIYLHRESDVVDDRLNFSHENMYKDLHEERTVSRSGLKMENAHDFKDDMTHIYGMTRGSNGDCNGGGDIVFASCEYEIIDTDQVEEAKVTGNEHQFEVGINNHNTSEEIRTAPVQEDFVFPKAEVDGLIPGSTVVNCRHEEEDNSKEKVLEEINKIPEASHTVLKGIDGDEMSEQYNSHLLTSGQKESLTLQNSSSLLHISSHQEDNVCQTKSFACTSPQASDWKQEGNDFDSSNLTMLDLDLVNDMAFEKGGKDYSQQAEAASVEEAEITTSEANLPCVPYLNNSIFANGGYEARESITRSSTESNPDYPNISRLIQKSPSFSLNLRIEATREESDQIPLLHQGKTAIESFPNQSSLNLMPSAEYEPRILQQEEVPLEEKIVTMERSYSEKLNAPFLGLLKEEEEAHLLVMPKKEDNHAGTAKEVKEMASASPKGKEKRKPKPSFFSSCMCCMTLTN